MEDLNQMTKEKVEEARRRTKFKEEFYEQSRNSNPNPINYYELGKFPEESMLDTWSPTKIPNSQSIPEVKHAVGSDQKTLLESVYSSYSNGRYPEPNPPCPDINPLGGQ
jgi:hypothetical protein